jgi:hypothetical protein
MRKMKKNDECFEAWYLVFGTLVSGQASLKDPQTEGLMPSRDVALMCAPNEDLQNSTLQASRTRCLIS